MMMRSPTPLWRLKQSVPRSRNLGSLGKRHIHLKSKIRSLLVPCHLGRLIKNKPPCNRENSHRCKVVGVGAFLKAVFYVTYSILDGLSGGGALFFEWLYCWVRRRTEVCCNVAALQTLLVFWVYLNAFVIVKISLDLDGKMGEMSLRGGWECLVSTRLWFALKP